MRTTYISSKKQPLWSSSRAAFWYGVIGLTWRAIHYRIFIRRTKIGIIDPKILKRKLTHQKRGRWADIRQLVDIWERKQYRRALEARRYAYAMRKSYREPSKKNNIKTTAVIDPTLMMFIQAFHPNFLKTKRDLREFKKRFPAYATRED